MDKKTITLTEKEFYVLAELLAANAVSGYRKAVGERIIVEVKAQFTTSTFNAIKRLERKVNG